MYPAYFQKLQTAVTSALTNHIAKGGEVPYELKPSLSLLLGQPVDSDFSPNTIAMAQMHFAQAQAAENQKSAAMRQPRASQPGLRELKQSSRLTLNPPEQEA
jgi:hypothetical protein